MTLRRIEFLLREARLSSNTQDQDAITDDLLVLYSNRVQSMIEDRLFITNSKNNLFMETQEITLDESESEYDLAFDIYAKNAIKSVGVLLESGASTYRDPIPFISESEDGRKWGYSLKEGKIVFKIQRNITQPIGINYIRKIPTLGKRLGVAITAFAAGTLTVGATTVNITDFEDFFCTVDANGLVQSRNNKILTYNIATGVLTFTAGTGTIANGQYVIPGKYATSHSQLPAECEKVFLEVLERRISQRQSSTDMNVISPLTEAEIALIDAVFAKGNEDNEIPPIVDNAEFC